ncbi:hypothetical protein CLOP_g5312 [Closterium sp. NIES-67]|nr:hypothetical protein CLOP_g5312 [Closterium sp. NIES-67]
MASGSQAPCRHLTQGITSCFYMMSGKLENGNTSSWPHTKHHSIVPKLLGVFLTQELLDVKSLKLFLPSQEHSKVACSCCQHQLATE